MTSSCEGAGGSRRACRHGGSGGGRTQLWEVVRLLTGLVVVGVVVLAVAVAFAMLRRSGGPESQVDRFEAARAVTNRWSIDPTSTPAPLRDYLAGRPEQPAPDEAREAGGGDPKEA